MADKRFAFLLLGFALMQGLAAYPVSDDGEAILSRSKRADTIQLSLHNILRSAGIDTTGIPDSIINIPVTTGRTVIRVVVNPTPVTTTTTTTTTEAPPTEVVVTITQSQQQQAGEVDVVVTVGGETETPATGGVDVTVTVDNPTEAPTEPPTTEAPTEAPTTAAPTEITIVVNVGTATTLAPEPVTEIVEVVTEVVEVSTEAVEVTTEAEELTTEAAEVTTEAEEVTTEAEEVTTEAAEVTTEAAEVTTEANESSTVEVIIDVVGTEEPPVEDAASDAPVTAAPAAPGGTTVVVNPVQLPNINVNTHNEIHNNLPSVQNPVYVQTPTLATDAPLVVETATKGPTIRIETTDEAKVNYDPKTGQYLIETSRPASGVSFGSLGSTSLGSAGLATTGLTTGLGATGLGMAYPGLGMGGLLLG